MSNIPTSITPVQEAPEPTKPQVVKAVPQVSKSDVEVPFTMYKAENKLPFTADYLDIKLTWDEAEMVDDVSAVEDYLTKLVMNGELENSSKAAKEKLKGLEKMAGIDKIESKAQRIIKLAEFVKYMEKLDQRKHDAIY